MTSAVILVVSNSTSQGQMAWFYTLSRLGVLHAGQELPLSGQVLVRGIKHNFTAFLAYISLMGELMILQWMRHIWSLQPGSLGGKNKKPNGRQSGGESGPGQIFFSVSLKYSACAHTVRPAIKGVAE